MWNRSLNCVVLEITLSDLLQKLLAFIIFLINLPNCSIMWERRFEKWAQPCQIPPQAQRVLHIFQYLRSIAPRKAFVPIIRCLVVKQQIALLEKHHATKTASNHCNWVVEKVELLERSVYPEKQYRQRHDYTYDVGPFKLKKLCPYEVVVEVWSIDGC